MKLASLRSSSPDGELVVVSRDLRQMCRAGDIAGTLQAALDNWHRCLPLLKERFDRLQQGNEPKAEAFDQRRAASPLPRAYQWLDGRAYKTHRSRITHGAPIPEWFFREAGLYQRASDHFLAPNQDIPAVSEDWEIDFEGEVAVVTDYVPYGTTVRHAAQHIQLVMLANDVSLRALQREEATRAYGMVHCKPAGAFSPVAVTPDELGNAWRDCRLHLPLRCSINGKSFGDPDAGAMIYGFDSMVAYAARTRSLWSGTIIGGGTVSNEAPERGYACIIERRAVEEMSQSAVRTPYLRFGDSVRIEMFDSAGRSLFGAIDQKVVMTGETR
jgi:fumarylacetoacetate (FAA) hydrolase